MRSQIDFELYNHINILNQIISVYDASEELSEYIESCLKRITSKQYNVAVVGEFNRGKSSLVNALLGGDILPTDILPTTAVINRITYDTREKADVYFKDGTVKTVPVENIIELVTKSTKEKEKKALSIDEVIIHYPAILCQNSIDIIDTPGLNENALMTEVTLNQLKKIDAAIMVVSALSPFSEIEKNIVVNMLKNNEINDIVFVVSFIDMINEEDRPKVINTVESRIKSIVEEFKQKDTTNLQIIEKATRMLSSIKVFGISSKMDLDAYKTGSNLKLEQSNFPLFRKELTGILTADQTINIVEKVSNATDIVEAKIESLLKEKEKSINKAIEFNHSALKEVENYIATSRFISDKAFSNAEKAIASRIKPVDFTLNLEELAIKELTEIKQNTYEEIIEALNNIALRFQLAAKQMVEADFENFSSLYDECITDILHARGNLWITAIEKNENIPNGLKCFATDIRNIIKYEEFPKIDFKAKDFTDTDCILHSNLMRTIRISIDYVSDKYHSEYEQYRVEVRKKIFSLLKIEKEQCETQIIPQINKQIEDENLNLILLKKEHIKNVENLIKLKEKNQLILQEVRCNSTEGENNT